MWGLPEEAVDTHWFFHVQQWITTHGNTGRAARGFKHIGWEAKNGACMRNHFSCIFRVKIQIITKMKKFLKQAVLSFILVFSLIDSCNAWGWGMSPAFHQRLYLTDDLTCISLCMHENYMHKLM